MTSGNFATAWSSSTFSNSGDSGSLLRMITPASTTTALSRNGIRQPQLKNACVGSAEKPRNAIEARVEPVAAPWFTQLA